MIIVSTLIGTDHFYLSSMYERQQHDWLEAQYGGDSAWGQTCGGWGWDPPCGGCIQCMHAQMSYYIGKEREQAYRAHAAGLEMAKYDVITMDYSVRGYAEYHGEGGYHCWTAHEIESPTFPWSRLS